MTAKQIVFPSHRAFNSDGAPEANATASLYLSGGLVPANFYSDSGLSVSLGSTITANAAGRFTPIPYGNDGVAYRLIIKDSEGNTLDDIDPFFFGLTIGIDGTSPTVDVGTVTTGSAGSSASVTNSGTVNAAVFDFSIPQGIQGPAGDVAKVADRNTLAAIASPTAKLTRYLAEAGREGIFVFDSSNLSTKVTADPNQGIYVPPASATSGASGAWVRKFEGSIKARWFGVAADNVTDDSTAIQAAITLANALATINVSGYGKGSPDVELPAGAIYVGSTIALGGASGSMQSAVRLVGQGSAGTSARPSTMLRFPANLAAGIETWAPGCAIERIGLEGGWVWGTTNEGEYHGIVPHYTWTIRDVFIQNFQGDGLHADCSSPQIANTFLIESLTVEHCRKNVYIHGSDANAGTILNLNSNYGRQCNIWDDTILGNTYIASQESSATTVHVGVNGSSNVPFVNAYNNGFLFTCKYGQATGAATNSPPSTATSNNYWLYWTTAASATAYAPQWTSGMNVRDGGSYVVKSPGALLYPYHESGYPPTQYGNGTLVLNGGPTNTGTPYGFANSANNNVETSALNVNGNFTQAQPNGGLFVIDGSAAGIDPTFTLKNGNSASTVNWKNSSGTTTGLIFVNNGSGMFLDATAGITLRYNGTGTATIGSSGFRVVTGSMGYGTGAGGTVTQATSRTTGVTLNKACGQITLVSAAGSSTYSTFTVTNSTVAATDTVDVVQQSGSNLYSVLVTAVAAGSFNISIAAVSGTATEAPVLNFAVGKSVTS